MLYQKGLTLAREIQDRELTARTLMGLANLAMIRGEVKVAQQRWEESLALYRELGNRRGVAMVLSNLSIAAREQGDYDRARSLLLESLRIHLESGDRAKTKEPLTNLGTLHMLQGDYEAARACFEESLAISRELGDQRWVATVVYNLAILARYQGQLEAALAWDIECARLNQETGYPSIPLGLGCVSVMMGERAGPDGERADHWYARGTRLFGASQARMEATGKVMWIAHDRAEYERCVAAARAALSEEAFAAAWSEGQAMSVEEALAYAQEMAGDA
jgi:tetratricopeptide (TPR) repeat protein